MGGFRRRRRFNGLLEVSERRGCLTLRCFALLSSGLCLSGLQCSSHTPGVHEQSAVCCQVAASPDTIPRGLCEQRTKTAPAKQRLSTPTAWQRDPLLATHRPPPCAAPTPSHPLPEQIACGRRSLLALTAWPISNAAHNGLSWAQSASAVSLCRCRCRRCCGKGTAPFQGQPPRSPGRWTQDDLRQQTHTPEGRYEETCNDRGL